MSPEQQNIKIHEALGYTPCPLFSCPAWSRHESGLIGPFSFYLPDYAKDLGRIDEAVMQLRGQLGGYCMELRKIVRRDTSPEANELYGDINYYHATASQRAEAFLRTLNLWEDAP